MKNFIIGYKRTKEGFRKELILSIPLFFIFKEVIMLYIRETLVSSGILSIINLKYYLVETLFFMLIFIPGFTLSKGRYWEVNEENIFYIGPTTIFNDLKEIYYFIVKKIEFKPNWKVKINNIETIEITVQKRLLVFATIGYPIYLKLTLSDGTITRYWVIENNQLVEIMNYFKSKNILIIDNYKIIDVLANKNIDLHKYLAKELKDKNLII